MRSNLPEIASNRFPCMTSAFSNPYRSKLNLVFRAAIGEMSTDATRTEIGAWLDNSRMLDNGALLTLYGRAAWAHDFGNTPSASAIFQTLPGSNFVVNGAAPAPDSALVTAGAQYRLTSGWSFLAKLDGEFSDTTSIYSGTGMVKKTW